MFSKFFLSLSAGKKIAYLAVFIALSVVANAFSIDVSTSQKITFTYLVCFLSGALFGAVAAFGIGFLGDAIGFLILPSSGPYWVLFSLSLGIYGFIAGIVFHCFKGERRSQLYLKGAIALIVNYILITLCINTVSNYYYLYIFYWEGIPKKAFLVFLGGRIAFQSVVYVINCALCMALLPVVYFLKPSKKTKHISKKEDANAERIE
ncbi:MAG: folate family ECF transporter S component [Clostridiales bacterium]|nr:folate family ECF transporter S component [Clostridiales bacterium]